jgi:L-ribulokinase
VLIPQSDVTSLGSAIFAAVAAGAFGSIEKAQDVLCPKYRIVEPDAKAVQVYEELYGMYRELYFAFGQSNAAPVAAGRVLPSLRRIARAARGNA